MKRATARSSITRCWTRCHAQKLNANVSLKLTHMGLDVDESMAYDIASELVQHAARINNFVRMDMEGSPYTQRTLDFVRQLHARTGKCRPRGRGDSGLSVSQRKRY